MANLTSKKSNLISRSVQANKQLLDSVKAFVAVRQEFLDLGFGEAGKGLEDKDFVGENDHITVVDFGAGLTIIAAIETLLADNGREGYKNLATLIR